jgi:hypothetical protein
MVGQAGEIVINRDRLDGMERGESLSPDEKAVKGEKDASGTPSVEDLKKAVEGGQAPEGDQPPDGTEVISEWQEGRHRVIERRAGPGEEVWIFVISVDAYTNS